MSADFVPGKEHKLDKWAAFICEYTNDKTSGPNPAWTHIPLSEVAQLNADYAVWNTAFAETLGPHTPVDTSAKNRAKKVLKAQFRVFINRFLRFPPVTDADRQAMGIPNRSNKRSRIPAPTSEPVADIMFPGLHLVKLVKIHKAGNLSDDPRSDYGVRIHFGILDALNREWRITAAPATGKDLPHSVFTREKKMFFDFEGESGKTIYFCLCYENQKGGKTGQGPFGPIISAVIP
jgi:hypothetical protein